MESTRKYTGIKYNNQKASEVSDFILIEKPLRIVINEKPFTITMRTPGDDLDLVRGLLFVEDVFKKTAQPEFRFSKSEKDCLDTMHVSIDPTELKDGYKSARNFLSLSSCGICGKTELPTLDGKLYSELEVENSVIISGLENMKKSQKFFNETGGCHGASILDIDGNVIVTREDIGRHNAVDKCIGALLNSNNLEQASLMLVSGRISYEIIIKTFRAKISSLAAISAPSSLSIDYAKEFGVALYAFCRGDTITKYS